MLKEGKNCIVGSNVIMGNNVILGHNVIIEDNVQIGDNSYIDNNSIIRSYVNIGSNAFIGSNCIIGEYQNDFCIDKMDYIHKLKIGKNALIRSGSIIYSGSEVGDDFQTGHHVTVREKTKLGKNVSIGTLSDIQGNCTIGNYVRMHSNVHIGQLSVIDDFVWIYPYVVLTNDPTPPSNHFKGVHVRSFAIIATGSIIMPGLEIGQDSLIGAGTIVTKSVDSYTVFVGNPGKSVSDVREVRNKVTGELVYPWREHFKTYMPWSESDFKTWYENLDLESKKSFNVNFNN